MGSLRRDLRRKNVRLMTYINPFSVTMLRKENHRRNLFAEASRTVIW